MPIFGGKQIAELQQKLAIGEQQYNDAQRTIAELSGLIERAGGGEITRMRALVEQTRREQEAAIMSLRRQHEQYAKQLAQEQAAAEKHLRDINTEAARSEAKLARVKAETMQQKEELRALGIRYDEGVKMLDAMTVYKDRRPYPHKLANAVEAYQLQTQNTHRAIDDATATWELLEAMEGECADLMRYINLFGYNPRFGVPKPAIRSITYKPQGYDRTCKLYEEPALV